MKAQVVYLTPRVVQLWIKLDHSPSIEEKRDLESRLEDIALTMLPNNQGLVYRAKENDRVGIIVVSEKDVLPYTFVDL